VHESAEQAKLRREQEIEIEKLRLQVQQLEFNKTRMTEVHGELQKQLDAARREVREALEAANSDEMTDLRDSIELLTIDKEMAEEKRDQLASELEDLKLKFEETNLELEMLQHEVQEGGQGEASTNFRVVELEKQNVKLKDGLVQLRDILNNEKADRHRLEKEVKALKDGNEDLEKMAEKLQAEALRTTEVVADLREQVSV
jgi:dynactin 1